jgi:hypothetical protein
MPIFSRMIVLGALAVYIWTLLTTIGEYDFLASVLERAGLIERTTNAQWRTLTIGIVS